MQNRDSNEQGTGSRQERGVPGEGQGRRDEVGGSGVYPASAGNAPDGAEIRNQAGWGQGERGAAGYEDAGRSELSFSEEQLRAAQDAETVNLSGDVESGSADTTSRADRNAPKESSEDR